MRSMSAPRLKQYANKSENPKPQSFLRTLLVIAVVAFATIFIVGLIVGSVGGFDNSCVARIQLNGEITYGPGNGLFESGDTAEEIMQQFKTANADPRVGAILFEINSPGGSAVASKEIYDELMESEKPVVAYLKEVAASGGYYVASPAHTIIANPNTITGSIGARATLLNYEQLFEKIGLKQESIQSGEKKDIGAGYREMTEEERALMEELIGETANNFAEDVRNARGERLNPEGYEDVLDARILTAKQALRIGMVDEIGGRARAEKKAAELAEMDSENGISFCEFKAQGGLLEWLSGTSAGFGTGFAKTFVSELQKERLTLQYR
ncbi:signal peptide peptidase SppA [Candidatus Micrarchaeota archaeon]|nr:signal peptide peptidase SppA [Candidatus Micrarchaeota archaeon]